MPCCPGRWRTADRHSLRASYSGQFAGFLCHDAGDLCTLGFPPWFFCGLAVWTLGDLGTMGGMLNQISALRQPCHRCCFSLPLVLSLSRHFERIRLLLQGVFVRKYATLSMFRRTNVSAAPTEVLKISITPALARMYTNVLALSPTLSEICHCVSPPSATQKAGPICHFPLHLLTTRTQVIRTVSLSRVGRGKHDGSCSAGGPPGHRRGPAP